MNIYDISKRAGVSIATVSRVLNNNSKVSESTRKKVLQVIEETGYTPNAFARGLGLNTMHTIGILCADSSDAYLAASVYHLEQCLRKNNYDSLLCCTGYDYKTKSKYMDLLLSKRVDAIILAGSNFVENDSKKNEYICQAAKEVPIIIVGGYIDDPNIYCSLCDDFTITYQMTKHILSQGRRHPVFFSRLYTYGGLLKEQGYRQAMVDSGYEKDSVPVLQITLPIPEAQKKIAAFYHDYPFDAVLTADDELAVSTLKFALANRISVPEQLSITGYNNSSLALCCQPELTSIDNKVADISIGAVELLMKVLNGKTALHKAVYPAQVIFRDSTLPTKGSI